MTTTPFLHTLLDEYRRAQSYSVRLVSDLDPDQVAWRPHERSSAIGWHLGHTAAVNHYLVRNLTAAAPSIDHHLDRLFDSATIEPERGSLPPIERTLAYRHAITSFTEATITTIAAGSVSAPKQLGIIAVGMLTAVINHEYQHDKWIAEVRADLGVPPTPPPEPNDLTTCVEGYLVITSAQEQTAH
jgi:DinB superfamily